MPERNLVVKLDDQTSMVVIADQVGPALVADADVLARLGTIMGSIERVSRDVLTAVKNAGPTKATVELGFSLAIESGQLVAMFGKGRGEATVKVTLEWSKDKGED